MEEKIEEIISECFDKLCKVFEKEGLELGYEHQEYVKEMIIQQYHIEKGDENY